jgi:hypothetical protein
MAPVIARPWTSQPQISARLDLSIGFTSLLLPSIGFDLARTAKPYGITGAPTRVSVPRGIAYGISSGNIVSALAENSLSLTECTVLICGSYTGTLVSNTNGEFGVASNVSNNRLGAHIPYSDGTVYFDFGGTTEGTTRKSVAGLTFGLNDAWIFSVGSRGMEIWQNGILRGSNAATPTRSNSDASTWGLQGQNVGSVGNTGSWWLFGYVPRQLPTARNAKITRQPFSIFQPIRQTLWSVPAVVSGFKPAWVTRRSKVIGSGVI